MSTPPLHLAAGDWEATILPAQGAALSALRHRGRDLIVPVPPGADPNGGFWGAFWMIPWANRLDRGRLPFGGRTYHLPVNHLEDDTAIHGLARDRPWGVEAAAPDRAVLVQDLDGPGEGGLPFQYHARVEVVLAPDAGVTLAASVTNTAADPFPFGLGWHPFFVRPRGTRLAFHAATMFGHDARTLPVAPRATTGIQGGEDVYLGLDTHFAGWDGRAEIALPGGDGGSATAATVLRLVADGAWNGNLQVFAPRAAAVLCVEPQSHVPDAPNRPELATAHGAMTVLAHGQTIAGRLAISVA